MTDFITILFVVFGILQIILFFKLWVMTDDIRKIRKIFSPYTDNENLNDAKTAFLNGHKEIAKLLLDKEFEKCQDLLSRCDKLDRKDYEKDLAVIKSIYEKYDIDTPTE